MVTVTIYFLLTMLRVPPDDRVAEPEPMMLLAPDAWPTRPEEPVDIVECAGPTGACARPEDGAPRMFGEE